MCVIRTTGSYLVVSGVCFALNNALLIGFDVLGLPLWLNLALTTVVAIVVGAVLLSLFVFRSPVTWSGLRRYSLVLIANMPIAYGLLWLATMFLPMHFAAPLVTTAMLGWNAIGSIWALKRGKATA